MLKYTRVTLIGLVASVVPAEILYAGNAYAIDVTVRVTIERIKALDNFGTRVFPERADFYAVVTISGKEFDNKNSREQNALEDRNDISPNWQFSQPVDFTSGSIPVTIRIFDEDGALRFGDDQADLDPKRGRGLELAVILAPCSISGDVVGSCGTSLVSAGTEDDRAQVRFRIDVIEPPSAPGSKVKCIHDPIWPQRTDKLTITADALDGSLKPKIADSIEIWVNDQTGAASVSAGTTLTHTAGPFPGGGTIAYGCRVIDGGVAVFSGWRLVNIGPPVQGSAVPVLFTGPRSSAIDIVFVPDKDSYPGGSTDSNFLSDVKMILGVYYSEDIYIRNQDKMNFWIAQQDGDAKNDCESNPPSNWDSDYAFADAGAIVHRDSAIRDCAPRGERFFSGDATRMDGGKLGRVFLHETGHRPFGLADEYCCDGGYFQNGPFPNLFEEPEDCRADPLSVGRTCREFDGKWFWFFDKDWSTSDPTPNDLMVDNLDFQALDNRRENWLFDNCASARC